MNQIFKIFPSIGYRNTQFQVIGFVDNLTIHVEYEGQHKIQIDLPQNNKAVIKKFTSPGQYVATCNLNGIEFKQKLEVKDAIRLGSSELKSAFTFDQIPYSIFLMRDRMLIYDETEKEIREENEISPSDIKPIDESHLLLVTRLENSISKKGITNYGIYSLLNFSIVAELTSNFKEIFHNDKENILWLYNILERKILCFDLKSVEDSKIKIVIEVESINSYSLNKLGSHLYAQSDKSIFIINIYTFSIEYFEKESNVAFDEDGNYFILKNEVLSCTNLLTELCQQISYNPPRNFKVSSNRFYYLGNDFTTDEMISDFDDKANEISKNNISYLDNTKTYQYLSLKDATELVDENIIYEIYPSDNGIHITIEQVSRRLNGAAYRKDIHGEWKCSPDIITTHTYSLIHNSGHKTKTIIESSLNFKVCGYFEKILIIRDDNKTKFIKQGQIIREIETINEYSIKAFHGTKSSYLFEKSGNKFNVFSSVNLDNPILNNVEILNYDLIEKQAAIWYLGDEKSTIQNFHYLKGYNLITRNQIFISETDMKHSRFSDAKEITFKEKYFISSSKALVHPLNCEIKDAAFGSIINNSNCLNKVITRRDEILYLLKFDPNSKKYSEEIIEINIQKNNESYFSPNGKFLMLLKQSNDYVYYDIENDIEIKFFTEKFIAFSNEGNLIFENDTTRSAKIIDPLTFEDITPPNYHHYRFLSPDGKLYSQLSVKVRYYDKVQENFIDQAAALKLRQELDEPSSVYFTGTVEGRRRSEIVKARIDLNRKKYFDNNKTKLNLLGIEDYKKVNSFKIVRVDKSTEIGIVGTNKTVEIKFPEDLAYYNYASFSYDNQYFGYVGKPSSNGLIHLFKLNFNENDNTLEILDSYLSRYPRYASWVCGFSKNGYFATYDSTPDTYIISADNEFFEQKTSDEDLRNNILGSDTSIYSSFKKWNQIKGKNFLCFSPSGNFLALSEQGYEPLTLGGYGHQESSSVHIAKTTNGEIVDSFLGHGDKIKDDKYKKVVFVAFSEDEKQIMSMSEDGVVIVRKIDLQHVSADKKETAKNEEYASR